MERDNMSDLLNTFKNILNNSSITPSQTADNSDTIENNSNNNMNITPEMITQIANNIKNQSSQSSSSDSINTNKNLNFNSNHNPSNNNSENTINLDLDTILKFKNIIDSFNQTDDSKSNLLYSLKPYLRKSRQNRIDQYVNIFKLSRIAKILKQEKGDLK